MAFARPSLFCVKYLWAAPYTLVGLLLAAAAVLFGAHVHLHRGVIEVVGGAIGSLLSRLPAPLAFSAMTLGHVILAVDRSALAELRPHERVHVRQYERWGVLFIPAYLASSVLQLLRGRDPYRHNHFERQAFALAPARKRSGPPTLH